MKRVWRVVAIVFLAITSVAGIANAVNEFGQVETALQMSVEVGDALWGIFGILTAFGATAAISALIVWAARVAVRAPAPAASQSTPV